MNFGLPSKAESISRSDKELSISLLVPRRTASSIKGMAAQLTAASLFRASEGKREQG
jgi:hypothetical protein